MTKNVCLNEGSVYDSIIRHTTNVTEYTGKYLFIDLWANSDRYMDFVGGNPQCPHVSIENNICKHCGAFAGHIGEESDWYLYFKHVMMIDYLCKDINFIIISHRDIPSYINKIEVMYNNMNFSHERVNIYSTSSNKYAMIFGNKEDFIRKYSLTVTREDIYSFLLKTYPVSEYINPTKKVLLSGVKLCMSKCNKGFKYD